jgi:hypothetical protein
LERGGIPWRTNLQWIHGLEVPLAREDPRPDPRCEAPNRWKGRL